MDPRYPYGLFNPHPRVRGGAVEAVGKVYGVREMKKFEREERDAKARMKRLRAEKLDAPFILEALTAEEQAAYDELIKDDEGGEQEDEEGEEEAAPAEDVEGEGEPAELKSEESESAVGVAVGQAGEEEAIASSSAAGENGKEKPAAKQESKVRPPCIVLPKTRQTMLTHRTASGLRAGLDCLVPTAWKGDGRAIE